MSMEKTVILILDIEVYLPYSESLKDKRQIRRSVVDRLKARYNISIAETQKQDSRKELVLTIAYVAISASNALNIREKIIEELGILVDAYQGQLSVHFDII